MDHSENEDITIKRADGTEKVLKTNIESGYKCMSTSEIFKSIATPENTPLAPESHCLCGNPVVNMSAAPDHLV